MLAGELAHHWEATIIIIRDRLEAERPALPSCTASEPDSSTLTLSGPWCCRKPGVSSRKKNVLRAAGWVLCGAMSLGVNGSLSNAGEGRRVADVCWDPAQVRSSHRAAWSFIALPGLPTCQESTKIQVIFVCVAEYEQHELYHFTHFKA